MPASLVDLHLHSNHSDGSWSPKDLVEHAMKIGMTAIALTDHDTVSGIKDAIIAAGDSLEIIPGTELNCIWRAKDGRVHDLHVLGYFIDPHNLELNSVLAKQRSAREEHALALVKQFNEQGIEITMELVHQHAKNSPIGKIHLTQAIVTAGGAESVTEAYNKFFIRHEESNRTFPFLERKSMSPADAVRIIKLVGGIASFAHPAYSPIRQDDMLEMLDQLKAEGLDGLEVFHPSHSAEAVLHLTELARTHDLLATGGSDCHGPFGEHESMMGTVRLPEGTLERLKQRRYR